MPAPDGLRRFLQTPSLWSPAASLASSASCSAYLFFRLSGTIVPAAQWLRLRETSGKKTGATTKSTKCTKNSGLLVLLVPLVVTPFRLLAPGFRSLFVYLCRDCSKT